MNEIIEVQFKKNGKRLRVKRQRPGGIEFDERDPLERTVGIKFSPDNEITRMRMDSIRRIQGWDPGVFKLKMGVEDGSILLRGANELALPEGRYRIRLQIEEADSPRPQVAAVAHDGRATITIDVSMDDRSVDADLTDADESILAGTRPVPDRRCASPGVGRGRESSADAPGLSAQLDGVATHASESERAASTADR